MNELGTELIDGIKHIERSLMKIAVEAANTWVGMQRSNPTATLYAYFQSPENDETFLRVVIAGNSTLALLSPARLYPLWTREECAAHIRESMRGQPVLNPSLAYSILPNCTSDAGRLWR